MLLTLNKIREIVIDLNQDREKGKIKDYRIQMNGDMGVNVYVLTEQSGLDYSKYEINDLIQIEEITTEEFEEDDYHQFIFQDKQKINLGYRERLTSLLDRDIENKFDTHKQADFPPIVTFYSYKGGLGRTTTLAGFAMHCAHHLGMRVLIIDCDLKAPGVTGFYDIDADILSKTNGIVEYLLNKRFDEQTALNEHMIHLDKKYTGDTGDIFILPAGNLSDDLVDKDCRVDSLEFERGDRLNRYDIHRTHYLEGLARLNISNPESIMRNFAALIQEVNDHPDYHPDMILIDSETGFSETLGIFVLHVSDIIVGFFREESQAKPGLHFLFEKTAENKKSQDLIIVNAITSDLQRTRKFEADTNFLAESLDTGEGPYPFDFASVHENPVLKNLGGDSDIADLSFIELIAQRQFQSYNHLFGILEEKIETSGFGGSRELELGTASPKSVMIRRHLGGTWENVEVENMIEFEGPEKKLEIILSSPQPGLRSNADRRWDRVVEASRSFVISKTSTEELDAYLLSESSLFVWDDAILMITCGQTTLIHAIPEILNILDRERIAFLFYERKNFMFPDDQPSNFEHDAKLLLKFLPGKSYRLGPANHDHLHVFHWARPDAVPEPDATLQVLMSPLDPAVMDIFSEKGGRTPAEVGRHSKVHQIYSHEMITDDHLFSPFGYSMNGIIGTNYFTVHVTPQLRGSYASFETNIIEKDYADVISKVMAIFRPENVTIALTTSMEDHFLSLHPTVSQALPGYAKTERSLYEFDCGYAVTFLNYKK